MQRGPTTAALAVAFYAGLLFWAQAWKSPAPEPELAGAAPTPPPAEAPEPTAPPEPPAGPEPAPEADPLPPEELAPAEFAAERSPEGVWEIDGNLGDEGVATKIRQALAAGGEVAGDITVSEDIEPAAWGEALASWIPKHLAATTGPVGLGVFDGRLLIAGDVASNDARDALVAAARSHFADSPLEIVTEIAVASPPEPAEFAIAPGENGSIQIAGQLGDPDLKQRLLEIIAEITDGVPVEDNLAVSDAVAEAEWGQPLLQVLPALLVEVQTPQVMARTGVFLMAGSVTGETTRDALAQLVEQSFADSPVSIENQIEIAAVAEPASIAVARGEDGSLTITGLLPDADAAERVRAAMRTATAGSSDPIDEIEVAAGVTPAPWVDKIAELVGPFAAAARWGALSVHGDQVALEAEVADPESADVLTALVGAAFPEPAFKRVVEVSVAAPAGPSDEDITRLDTLARDTVIYFSSNSADVAPESREEILALADAIAKVPGSGVALLGNVDSRGSATYNRKLAQRRCDAVRAILEEAGIESLLIEDEVRSGPDAKPYEHGRRVEFELR